ncbi:hypothetical protein OBV_27850 [Oscillibacter valericigenes Sjm18-20]|nr:hypothetical protein OBV_27850 [Oscillibacter valericigenes Sjm18-20]
MELFNPHGHLTDDALKSFSVGGPLTELERLEIAEHLDFCDECLMRSIEFLPEDALLTPACSCRDTLWKRIRQRAVRVLTSRYATAAAAIAIAAGLWSFNIFGGLVAGSAALSNTARYSQRQSDFSEKIEQLDRAVSDGLSRLNQLFDFGGGPAVSQTNPLQSQGGLSS